MTKVHITLGSPNKGSNQRLGELRAGGMPTKGIELNLACSYICVFPGRP